MSPHHAAPLRRASSLLAMLALAACSADASRGSLAPTSPHAASSSNTTAAVAEGIRDPLQLCGLDL